MTTKTSDVIAAEIKIGIATNSWEELQELTRKIRATCQGDYKLTVNIEGDFFKQPEQESNVDKENSDSSKDFFGGLCSQVADAYSSPLSESQKATLGDRVTNLEKTVAEIVALPQMTKLAERDNHRLIKRVQWSLDDFKRQLDEETLSDEERQELKERIDKYESLVSPALSLKPRDSEATESPNEVDDSVELRRKIDILYLKMTLCLIEKVLKSIAEPPELIKEVRECFLLTHELVF